MIKAALSDPLVEIRAAAVKALRFIHAPDVDSLIADVVAGDPELIVRRSAMAATNYRTLTKTLIAALARALESENEASARMEIIDVLRHKLRQAPEVRSIIEKAASSDPSADVRKAARDALQGRA